MKKWAKVVLIILLLLVILVGAAAAYGYYTYKQIMGVVALAKDASLQQNMEDLMKGNCTKLSPVETKVSEMKIKVSALCDNFLVRIAIAQGWVPNISGGNAPMDATKICAEINSPNSEMEKALGQIRTYCANQTAVKQ